MFWLVLSLHPEQGGMTLGSSRGRAQSDVPKHIRLAIRKLHTHAICYLNIVLDGQIPLKSHFFK